MMSTHVLDNPVWESLISRHTSLALRHADIARYPARLGVAAPRRGVGMGYSQHSGVVIVCDGSVEADKRIARVLWNDPATGVMRHADAGYEIAKQCAKEQGLKLPMA